MQPLTVHDMADSEAVRPVLSMQVSLACVNAAVLQTLAVK